MSVEPAAVRQPDMQVEPAGESTAAVTDSPSSVTMSVEDEEEEVSKAFLTRLFTCGNHYLNLVRSPSDTFINS